MAAWGTLHYLVHGRSSQTFGATVHQGAGKRRSVALTFDDGPSPQTADLLEYLRAEGIKATFFQCGLNVLRQPALAKRVAAEGHEVGNHTFSHARLCPQISRAPNIRSPRNIYRELADTQEILGKTSGKTPTLFRPPYGLRWFGVGGAQRRLGLLNVLWTVIAHDWEWPAERIAQHVLPHVTPGGILCFHDGRDTEAKVDLSEMLAALKLVIPVLKQQGYAFETVTELLTPDPA